MKTLIKLLDNPHVLISGSVTSFLNPTYIYIPTFNTNLKIKERVIKDTYLGTSLISISGTVLDIVPKYYNGKIVNTYKIKNDFKEYTGERKHKRKLKDISELQELLKSNYLFNLANLLNKDNLVISCFDEEIYEMNEFMGLNNNDSDILKTIDELRSLLKLEEVILAIKNTNAKCIKKVRSILGIYPSIKLVLLPDKYLMSYPENLCSYLNLDVQKTSILTTFDIYTIFTLKEGKKIDHKLITVSGDALKKSLIIDTKIGTSLQEIIQEFLKINTSEYNIYYNGYLRGTEVNSDDVIVTYETRCIVINQKEEEESECLNCGACYKICPQNINVKKCYFQNLTSSKCLNCGLCAYICPAHLKLKKVYKGDDHEKTRY